jgi:hypothetical protein
MCYGQAHAQQPSGNVSPVERQILIEFFAAGMITSSNSPALWCVPRLSTQRPVPCVPNTTISGFVSISTPLLVGPSFRAPDVLTPSLEGPIASFERERPARLLASRAS